MQIPEPEPAAVPPEGPEVEAILKLVAFLGVLDMPQPEQDRVGELIVRLRMLHGQMMGIDGAGLPRSRGRS